EGQKAHNEKHVGGQQRRRGRQQPLRHGPALHGSAAPGRNEHVIALAAGTTSTAFWERHATNLLQRQRANSRRILCRKDGRTSASASAKAAPSSPDSSRCSAAAMAWTHPAARLLGAAVSKF